MNDHHGSNPFDPTPKRSPLETDPTLRRLMHEINSKALGEYPGGKLNERDEGALAFAIGNRDGNVILHFPKPVAWVGMPAAQAVELAKLLIAQARKADPHLIVTIDV